MNVDVDLEEEVNLIKDVRAPSNACYKCGEMGHFQRDCKYDGDKPSGGKQEQGGISDSYEPVVGKWMTNLVATTPITARAMKNLYAELNRQKELKRTYRRRYKDLQVVVATSTDMPTTIACPNTTSSNKATQNVPAGNQVTTGAQKKAPVKNKTNPLSKGKKNLVKPTNATSTSSAALCSQSKERAKQAVALIQELAEELQAIEEESAEEEQASDATRASDLGQEDTDVLLTEDEQ